MNGNNLELDIMTFEGVFIGKIDASRSETVFSIKAKIHALNADLDPARQILWSGKAGSPMKNNELLESYLQEKNDAETMTVQICGPHTISVKIQNV